jgi:hypothetical protein
MSKEPVALRRAPTVDVTLPGENGAETFKLAFDFKAICQVKKQTGRSMLSKDFWDTDFTQEPEMLVAIIWAGLQLYRPDLSLEDVAHLLLPSRVADFLPQISLAWAGVSPEKEEDADPKSEPTAEPVAAQ